ncbi:MAG: hypothetical protein AAGE03_01115 [Pseudomonadota bacterium]
MKDLPESSDDYPGATATPREILELALAYADAARSLLDAAGKDVPLSYAPARLCAIHATELFLNAFLRFEGTLPECIRARGHHLAYDHFSDALRLKKKTAGHLVEMTDRREYLLCRYAPDLTSHHTPLNRLRATLDEVEKKVTALIT